MQENEESKRQHGDFKRLADFADHLKGNAEEIVASVIDYESYAVACDEIARSIQCLQSVNEIETYFHHQPVDTSVAYLPANLPLYSLVLFAVVPSLQSKSVYVKPPERMGPTMKKLLAVLKLEAFFSNVHVCFDGRTQFFEKYVSRAEIVIFTGRRENATNVLRHCQPGSTFLFNGWGCNPLVVFPNCQDINLALEKTAEVKLFNSGQDCAGPDTILVHETVMPVFMEKLIQHLDNAKVAKSYHDREVTVGPLSGRDQLVTISKLLVRYHKYIVYGGTIDFKNTLVTPTVIVAPIEECRNFDEFFSPVLFVNTFKDEKQLELYFTDPAYKANEMYVSFFGEPTTSMEMFKKSRSIVLKNTIILDVERGNNEFGGFSLGASFVAYQRRKEARPILVPREIAGHAQRKMNALSEFVSRPQYVTIVRDFQDSVTTSFEDGNVVFAFIGGSVAKGFAKRRSDINTMVVLKRRNGEQEGRYLEKMKQLHEKVGLVPDVDYPAEFLSLDELDAAMEKMPDITFEPGRNSSATFDLVVWGDMLAGKKKTIVGDSVKLNEITRQCSKIVKKWCSLLEALELPEKTLGDVINTKTPSKINLFMLLKMNGISFDAVSYSC